MKKKTQRQLIKPKKTFESLNTIYLSFYLEFVAV